MKPNILFHFTMIPYWLDLWTNLDKNILFFSLTNAFLLIENGKNPRNIHFSFKFQEKKSFYHFCSLENDKQVK